MKLSERLPRVGAIFVLAAGMAPLSFATEELATGTLAIRGTVIRVSPEHQEVAPGLPTVVLTSLGQLEPGQIPAGLRVEGDLSGPGLSEPLRLTTTPGDAFRIPGLNREGSYTLSGIRLVEGDRTISVAKQEDRSQPLTSRIHDRTWRSWSSRICFGGHRRDWYRPHVGTPF
jgi:hypothetical protein